MGTILRPAGPDRHGNPHHSDGAQIAALAWRLIEDGCDEGDALPIATAWWWADRAAEAPSIRQANAWRAALARDYPAKLAAIDASVDEYQRYWAELRRQCRAAVLRRSLDAALAAGLAESDRLASDDVDPMERFVEHLQFTEDHDHA